MNLFSHTHSRVIPQLAVLIVCYFWTEFQVHAADLYHRYITRDISLAIEVGENVGSTALTIQDIDGVVSQRLEELLPKLLGQLVQTITNDAQVKRTQSILANNVGHLTLFLTFSYFASMLKPNSESTGWKLTLSWQSAALSTDKSP